MNLYSPEFFLSVLILLYFYYTLDGKYQKILLLISSSCFIALFSTWFLIYTYLFIGFNYLMGLLINSNMQKERFRSAICSLSILVNIFSLVFFKYINFIIENIVSLFQITGHRLVPQNTAILVPIGISYYTFQGISYLLQVYRRYEKAEKNIIVFSNFMLFFPKFLAGPIELSKKLIPQLKIVHNYDYTAIKGGFQLILWGAFKKIVIADRLAMLINGVYANVEIMTGNPVLITFILQPLHLYCDFSGYTDIALGIGQIFGLKLTNNFNRPFFSTSVTMFWRRWHISLSSWCNDFIFKPLLFKFRKWGIWASIFAVIITFIVIGIWHGADWKFVILGLLQAVAISYEFFTKKYRIRIASKLPQSLMLYLSYFLTYTFFCFTLIFFNAASLRDVGIFLSHMFVNLDITSVNVIFLERFDKLLLFSSLTILLLVEYRQEQGKDIFTEINLWPKWMKNIAYYSIIALVVYFGSPHKELVYMQF